MHHFIMERGKAQARKPSELLRSPGETSAKALKACGTGQKAGKKGPLIDKKTLLALVRTRHRLRAVSDPKQLKASTWRRNLHDTSHLSLFDRDPAILLRLQLRMLQSSRRRRDETFSLWYSPSGVCSLCFSFNRTILHQAMFRSRSLPEFILV